MGEAVAENLIQVAQSRPHMRYYRMNWLRVVVVQTGLIDSGDQEHRDQLSLPEGFNVNTDACALL